MSHFMISAAHKSSGKTTISLGICAALQKTGLQIQPFKKGPDYIDPMWLSLASGRQCYNLDFNTMARDEIRGKFSHYAHNAEISLIEGNKGLYDGLDLEGRNSNAALARMLKAPIILVIDAQGMTRGIAPLILGYQAFDSRVNIAGVILNKLGGKRHEGKLRAVIEHYTDVEVIGAVHKDDRLLIKEQHLGLVPSQISAETRKHIDTIASLVGSQIELNKLIQIAKTAPAVKQTKNTSHESTPAKQVRIGIARDKAFGFYYPDDLEALQNAGAVLIEINMLEDKQLPEIDGLFIGGGFPESFMAELSANTSMRESVKNAIESGLPTYAECGGLMYLTRSIQWQNNRYPMVGIIQAETEMCDKPQGRGYVRLKETEQMCWPHANADNPDREFCAHEFHYSHLIHLSSDYAYAYKVLRGAGITGKEDGLLYKNLLASYSHMRDVAHNHWTTRFVSFVRSFKN